MTTYRGAILNWTGRQLNSYSKNGTSISYTYDADGLRGSKTINGAKSTYQYVDGTLLYEDHGGTDLYYYYDSYGTITAISAYLPNGASGYVFVGTNSLGDVNALYNANGEMIVKYEYDAWGRVLAETDANGNALTGTAATWNELNPFRYRGYYYDAETGLYYLQSRYYDPEVGRFISADAIVNTTGSLGFNIYAYCYNNPNSYYDSTGSFPWVLLFIGVVVVGGIIWGASSDNKLWEVAEENDRSDVTAQGTNKVSTNNGLPAIDKSPSNNILPQNNKLPQKGISSYSNVSQQNEKIYPIKEHDTLTMGERAVNALIGASLGLLVSGGIVCTAGVIGTVLAGSSVVIPLFGVTGPQAAAIGALAYNFVAMVMAPAMGVSIETIEFKQ